MSSPGEFGVTIYMFNYLLDWRFTVWSSADSILKVVLFPPAYLHASDQEIVFWQSATHMLRNREFKSWKRSSKLTFSWDILIQQLCCPPGIHRVPHSLECSKSFKVQPWEQEGNKKGASMLINSNAYYKGQLQWCAKRHQKSYTIVSQPRMQKSAFNVESQRIYSCCCIAIFNEWSRKDCCARQKFLVRTELTDFWKICRRVHKFFLFEKKKKKNLLQQLLYEEMKGVQRKINCTN